MKKLVAALVLGALLVAVGIGCSNPTTPAKPPATDKSKETEKPKTP
jgi:hypothetical protein